MANWNIVQDLIIEALVQAGQKVTKSQIEGKLSRNVLSVLEDIDYIIDWDIATADYSVTVNEGEDNASIGAYTFFKEISCTATIGDDDYTLEFLHLSELKALSTSIDTNSYPDKYSLAGNRIYVGPGLMAADITVSGAFRRKLTIADIPYLPSSLIVDRMLMRMVKPGTPDHIAAWSGWKEGIKRVQKHYKLSAEKWSNMNQDERVSSFNAYLDTLD